jgi:uncharacterized protein
MQAPVKHIINGQTLWLSGERVIFWEDTRTIIVSDCHFGKTGHFRKSGISVPQKVFRTDMQRLLHQVQHFNAQRVLVTGDFFHSEENSELDFFRKWRKDIAQVQMLLVKGNHDILDEKRYEGLDMELHHPVFEAAPFVFCHDAADIDKTSHSYAFTGHIHPGIRINGLGRQSLQFPCFYFTDRYCILPAFSHFTGSVPVKPGKQDKVFAIVSQKVMEL